MQIAIACKFELVIFDIAGTTVHASDEVPAAFRDAFSQFGYRLDGAQIAAIRGKSKRDAIADLLRELGGEAGQTEAVFQYFRAALKVRYAASGVRAIDGASQTFAWLHDAGVKVALNSGFDRYLLDPLLDALQWRDAVDVVVCADDVCAGRPAPDLILAAMQRGVVSDVNRVVVVGDTISDLQAAENAGVVHAFGVLSGAHSRGQLQACAHYALLSSVAGLPAALNAACAGGD